MWSGLKEALIDIYSGTPLSHFSHMEEWSLGQTLATFPSLPHLCSTVSLFHCSSKVEQWWLVGVFLQKDSEFLQTAISPSRDKNFPSFSGISRTDTVLKQSRALLQVWQQLPPMSHKMVVLMWGSLIRLSLPVDVVFFFFAPWPFMLHRWQHAYFNSSGFGRQILFSKHPSV